MKKNKIILLSLIIGTTVISNKINEKQEVKAANDTYSLVTDATTLKDGDIIVLGSSDKGAVAGDISKDFLSKVTTTFVDNIIESLPKDAIEFTLSKDIESNNWIFLNNEQKLGATKAKAMAWDSGTFTWSVSILDGKATIASSDASYGKILYNTGSPRFLNYTSNVSTTMILPEIYKKDSEKTLNEKFVNIKTKTNLKFDYNLSEAISNQNISYTPTELAELNNLPTAKTSNITTISLLSNQKIKMTATKNSGTNPRLYYNNKNTLDFRLYNTNTISFSCTDGYIINEINFYDSSNKVLFNKTNIENDKFTITSGMTITKIELSYTGLAKTYTNFNNLQIQYQYSFDVSSYTEVQEVGIFVTDDEKFNFYTDGTYDEETPFEIGLTTGTKGHRFVNSSKKETYTVGVNLGNDIEGAILTTLRASAYIKVDNKYYFSKNISEYNLQTMLEEYSKLTLEGEGNAIVDSFLSYVNSL